MPTLCMSYNIVHVNNWQRQDHLEEGEGAIGAAGEGHLGRRVKVQRLNTALQHKHTTYTISKLL